VPKKNNPFKPTQPIYRGVFAGRIKEIDRIETILRETRDGNPTNLLVVGERGIGKTSLLLLTRYLATGDITLGQEGLAFLTVFVSLDKRTGVGDLARKIKTDMERQLRKSRDAAQFLKDAWGFLQRIEIASTKIGPIHTPLTEAELFDGFAYSMVDSVKTITSREDASSRMGLARPKDGLVVFIDEADSACEDLDLGTLVKQLSEKLVAENCERVLVVLAGLPEVRDVLIKSHASSLRLFEELELSRLDPDDVKKVITQGLSEANKKNAEPVQISEDALNLIVMFSEGYPHFVQQFGYSSYAEDSDNLIDADDVKNAAYSRHGAFDLIGDRYYKDMYFNRIRKDSYRQVLKIMSENWNNWISKKEIRAQFKGREDTLNNALKALADRNIILRRPGVRGQYRLQWAGFAFWIKLFATRMEESIEAYNGGETTASS